MAASQEEGSSPHHTQVLKNLTFYIPLKQISFGGGSFNLPPPPKQNLGILTQSGTF